MDHFKAIQTFKKIEKLCLKYKFKLSLAAKPSAGFYVEKGSFHKLYKDVFELYNFLKEYELDLKKQKEDQITLEDLCNE